MKFAEPVSVRVVGLAMGEEFGERGDYASNLGDRCREAGRAAATGHPGGLPLIHELDEKFRFVRALPAVICPMGAQGPDSISEFAYASFTEAEQDLRLDAHRPRPPKAQREPETAECPVDRVPRPGARLRDQDGGTKEAFLQDLRRDSRLRREYHQATGQRTLRPYSAPFRRGLGCHPLPGKPGRSGD
ncbi:hypothetical protein HK102_012301 [Quaeritorhiza haematococci]|nr:hypothetical protein HK102_012301 [Quaeritorhiza haematococci]